jgi:hypothetical protein
MPIAASYERRYDGHATARTARAHSPVRVPGYRAAASLVKTLVIDREGDRMVGNGTVGAGEPIVYVDHSKIHDGAIEELKAGVQRLVEYVDAREPQLISYGFYIDEEAARLTVVAIHPDSASLELHMDVGGGEFRKLAHLLTLTTIECYGRPSERALEQLRDKAAALGDEGAVISVGRFAGFTRFESATT